MWETLDLCDACIYKNCYNVLQGQKIVLIKLPLYKNGYVRTIQYVRNITIYKLK